MIKKFLKKLFRLISYSIFFKIYGKIEKPIKSNDDERVKVKIVNIEKDLNYNVYNISNGRLYTDRVHDTAILIDNKIITEPSFQLRQDKQSKIYNSKIEDNIVFTKGTPRKLIKLNGSILSLLTGGGGNNNYWHWLFDVLPRFGLCNKATNISEIDYFLLPDHIKNFQIETLDLLNIPKNKRLSSKKYRHIKAEKLIVTDHPVVISGNATNDIMNMPGWISEWLKKNFLTENIKNDKQNIKKIYIDRNIEKSNQLPDRFIANEHEVKTCLMKKGFVPIKLHEIKFTDQINLFYNAEHIVGLHGGGFANLAFCKKETQVIELRSSTAGTPIENLAKKNNLNYEAIIVEATQIKKFSTPNQQGSIQVPIKNLTNILER